MDKGRGRGKDRRGEEEGVTGEGQVGREGMGRRQGGRRAGRETDLKTAWWLSFSDEMRVRGVLYLRRAIQIDVFTLFLPRFNRSFNAPLFAVFL